MNESPEKESGRLKIAHAYDNNAVRKHIIAYLLYLHANQITTVTMLLAPFMITSGIYGMNFERIPFSHSPHGFVLAVLVMLAASIAMLLYFRKKGWF